MATWKHIESGDTGRLIYAEKGLPVVGGILSLVGLAGTIGCGIRVVMLLLGSPQVRGSTGGYALGILLCVFALALGLKMLGRREVVLDRQGSTVVQTRCWLFWRHCVTTPLDGFTCVSWRHKWRAPPNETGSDTSVFPVFLTGREPELELLGEIFRMEEARRLTDEVAAFLGLRAEHLDKVLLAAAPSAPGARPSIVRGALAAQSRLWSPPEDTNQLIYRQSFPAMLKLFGAVALPIGLLFLLSPWLGIHIRMDDQQANQSPWAVFLIGGVFTGLGLLLLAGCRGFTIKRNLDLLESWWGLAIPLVSERHELGSFETVALQRRVSRTSSGYPVVRHGVSLQGQYGTHLNLFESLLEHDARSFGDRVATFLKWELVVDSEDRSH